MREEIQAPDLEIDNLEQQRKKTEHHIPVKSLPEEDRLHHLTQAAHDQAIEQTLADLNATQTVFPDTTLTLVFKLGSA